ncbi:MAG TPA: glutamate--tRNA ligase [Candidatus Acetothermia bacterium]|nr:glutamate--tRNA ligase [Candidatus Acetothermia bacterium]
MVKVRFAPSPTGYLHVGGARTALFNWLYARHQGGTFVLRIEDTDQERSTQESIDQILEAMTWLGLDWDEYYRQTDRTDVHLEAAKSLLEKGNAYEQDGAWWFKVPPGETVVHDILAGDVTFNHDQIKDFVIRRSDGTFVYNFVVVVDDADMGITHVIRGDDHLTNTPKQIMLYRALGRKPPKFAHLPMILGPDRTRLSKRHGVTSVLEYRRRGFLPEAMVNFFARLGWSHGDQEVFTRDELVKLFSLKRVGSSAAVFDEEKLRWLNQQHMKLAEPSRLVDLVRPFVLESGQVTEEMWSNAGDERLTLGAELLRHRCHTLVDLADMMHILFPVEIEVEAEVTLDDRQRKVIASICDAFSQPTSFAHDDVENMLREVLTEHGAKLKDVAHAIRVSVTGRGVGPGLFDILSVVGERIVVARLRKLLGG